MFGQRKPDQAQFKARLLQTQVELRRLRERFEMMLQRELREADLQRARGVARPSNYDRIKLVYHLLQLTERAYQETKEISSQDQLSRLTNELSAALGSLNALSGQSQKPRTGALRRETRAMDRETERRARSLGGMAAGLEERSGGQPFETVLEDLLAGERGERRPVSPALREETEQEEDLDALNRRINDMIDAL